MKQNRPQRERCEKIEDYCVCQTLRRPCSHYMSAAPDGTLTVSGEHLHLMARTVAVYCFYVLQPTVEFSELLKNQIFILVGHPTG